YWQRTVGVIISNLIVVKPLLVSSQQLEGSGHCSDLWQQCNLAPCFISWPTKQSRTVIESYTILTIVPCSVLFPWVFFFSPTTLFLRGEKNALYPIFKAIPSKSVLCHYN
uniref:Uncharacterized protein n=1 Tax=Ficedula albicollis TaxID=59894 RepID=A0A803VEN9_FICAL